MKRRLGTRVKKCSRDERSAWFTEEKEIVQDSPTPRFLGL